MYCFVIFQKGLRSVFDESSQTAWLFCTTSNIYRYIPTNSHKPLTNYIPVFSGRIILSIGENHMKIRAVVFEFNACRQTDRETRRRTLFYNEEMFLFVNHVKITEHIDMGLRPYDAKSFVDGHTLLLKNPYTIPQSTYSFP